MNIRTLQRGLQYCVGFRAVRQTYHVFESEGYFFVLSSRAVEGASLAPATSTWSTKAAVDYVHERVGGTARRDGEPGTRRSEPHQAHSQPGSWH